ncbi:MAG: C1 family peptidase [Clostridium sp.]
MKKRGIILIIALALGQIPVTTYGKEISTSLTEEYNLVKEYNPAYEEYLKKMETGEEEMINMPSPYIIDGTSIKNSYNEYAEYDPRKLNLMTSVKDQGTLDVCWSFASLGTLESYLALNRDEYYDFSEEHLRWWGTADEEGYGWHRDADRGGYDQIALGYFTAWAGPKLESDIPFQYSKLALKPSNMNEAETVFNVSSIMYLKNDKETIKNAVLKYGGVYTAYFHSALYYDKINGTYCYPGQRTATNHSVIIVGWDDNYPKENFRLNSSIENNGAWLVKSSWGNNNNEGGYIWVSYEDTSILDEGYNTNYSILEAEQSSNNYKLYQHDEEGADYTFKLAKEDGEPETNLYAANLYDFTEDYNILDSIVFQTTNQGATYDLYYIPLKEDIPDIENKIVLYSGIVPYSGYIKTNVNSFILPKGKGLIGVHIDNSINNKAASIGCQENLVYSSGEYLYKAKVNLGESYIFNEDSIEDLNLFDKTEPRNFTIKAITKKSNDSSISEGTIGEKAIEFNNNKEYNIELPYYYKDSLQQIKFKANNSFGKIISINNMEKNLNEVYEEIELNEENSTIEVICEAPDKTKTSYLINISFSSELNYGEDINKFLEKDIEENEEEYLNIAKLVVNSYDNLSLDEKNKVLNENKEKVENLRSFIKEKEEPVTPPSEDDNKPSEENPSKDNNQQGGENSLEDSNKPGEEKPSDGDNKPEEENSSEDNNKLEESSSKDKDNLENKVSLNKDKNLNKSSFVLTADDLNTEGFLITMVVFWISLGIIIHFNRKHEKKEDKKKNKK